MEKNKLAEEFLSQYDKRPNEKLNEEVSVESRDELGDDEYKSYDSIEEMFIDTLGPDWRKRYC